MEPFRFHLFVCTQLKPEGVPSCPASGSFAVLGALDREIQARGLNHPGINNRGLNNDVQLTTCGCMGLCDEGPVMVGRLSQLKPWHSESGAGADSDVWRVH